MKLNGLTSRRTEIALAFQRCRQGTLKLFAGIDRETLCNQAHPEFSPAGWHLGHIAYTEDLWLLQRCAGKSPILPQYRKLFAADGLPKQERVYLPTFAEILDYLESVRKQVLDYLEVAPIEQQERLWHFILQHESQHCETIAFVLLMQRRRIEAESQQDTEEVPILPSPIPSSLTPETIVIPAGEFEMGSDAVDALDNERSRYVCSVPKYRIGRYPVTIGEYRVFIEAGGYQNPEWWSAEGWQWQQSNLVTQPLYWSDNPRFDRHPVYGVSWYEADAYCRFVGKRLPTEVEWEKAASWDASTLTKRIYPWGDDHPEKQHCNHDNYWTRTTPVDAFPSGISAYGCYDLLGNVWEWTASWFEAYQGFQSYPYPGYSQTYFDGQHRVLKGGSWVTRPWAMRCSFRNWYHPGVRQILAGFRCAESD